jgi:hypothetical protein
MSIVPIQSSERGDGFSAAIGRQPSGSDQGRGQNQDELETLPSAAMTVPCWFCGEPESTVGKLLNIATAAYPRMCCSGCNGSRKALNLQGAANPTASAALKALKKRQYDYKTLVVNSVIPGANLKGQGGAVAKQARHEALGTFFTHSAESTVSLQHSKPMMWMLKDEFIAHHQNFKGKTKEEATAQWKVDKANVEVRRKGEGVGLRLAVLGIPTTTENVTRAAKRSLQASYLADTDLKMQAASKKMSLNNLPQMNSQMFLDAGGDVFGTGCASGSNDAHISATHIGIADEQPLQREEFLKAALALQDTVDEPSDEDDEYFDSLCDKKRTRHQYIETWCIHVVNLMYTCCKHVVHLMWSRHLVTILATFKSYVRLCKS